MLSLQGLRGTRPALAGKLGGGGAFALCARQGLIASNTRSGWVPLRMGLGWVFRKAGAWMAVFEGVVGDGAWLRGVLVVSRMPHGVL